jgi:hypothetical protein
MVTVFVATTMPLRALCKSPRRPGEANKPYKHESEQQYADARPETGVRVKGVQEVLQKSSEARHIVLLSTTGGIDRVCIGVYCDK